jgi:hypothetical protein
MMDPVFFHSPMRIYIMKIVTRIGTLVVSLAAAGLVFAQDAAAPSASAQAQSSTSSSVDFSSLDANKDGRVSMSEVQSNSELRSQFDSLDTNKDSYLTPIEFSKWNHAGKSKDSTSSSSSSDASTSGAASGSASSPRTPGAGQ